MTSILRKSSWALCLACILACTPSNVRAQETVTQTLSVSPTLFEMQAAPSQTWQSEIRVVNVNEYDLQVYPQVVNFAPLGEEGRGDLLPVFTEETQGQTLAEWVDIGSEPVLVPRQQTVVIPFTVTVPEGAAPGGHYAAVLVGTKPPVTDTKTSQVQTAQFVTSLLFVRVAGDIVEKGGIRELMTNKAIVQKPEVAIAMRFENEGNVHLQPQGDIKIFNMWGRERGVIPINQQTHFGNVLPQSIRKFTFTWSGETALYDIGRYKAVATLGYGDDKKQFVTATTYFWVIPYVTILLTITILFVLLKVVLWLIRRYIDRMLALSGVTHPHGPYVPHHERAGREVGSDTKTMVVGDYRTVSAPLRTGAKDVLDSWRTPAQFMQKCRAVIATLSRYRLFFLGALIVVGLLAGITAVVMSVSKANRHYEVTIGSGSGAVALSGEDVAFNELRLTAAKPPVQHAELAIDVVNVSGEVGAAAAARFRLEQAGYGVEAMTTDSARTEARSVIVCHGEDQAAALAMSKVLGGALVSATDTAVKGEVTIYAAKDLLSQP